MQTFLLTAILLADVVHVYQDGQPTMGVVVQASPCWVLTCKHNDHLLNPRIIAKPWSAKRGKISVGGKTTVLDEESDLALLISTDKWPGKATPVLPYSPVLYPTMTVSHDKMVPTEMYMFKHCLKPGDSGTPLLTQGKVSGILFGYDLQSPAYNYYTKHEHIARFLEHVHRRP